MTISSSTRKAGPYSCTGAITQFPFAFKVFTTADVRVTLTDAAGVETTLTLGADYTVTLNSNQDSNPGGTVTTTQAYGSGNLVTLTSALQNLQPITLTNNGGFYPQVIDDALDRLTIMVQQLDEQVSRSYKVAVSSNLTPSASLSQYLTQAQNSAASAATAASASYGSASDSATSAVKSSVSAASASAAAASAALSASTAAAPTGAALASFIDSFFPFGTLVNFTDIYVQGGWDLGSIAQASPFTNETAPVRRCSLSLGGSTYDLGTLP